MVPRFGHGTWIGKAFNDTPEMLHERVTFNLSLLSSHWLHDGFYLI